MKNNVSLVEEINFLQKLKHDKILQIAMLQSDDVAKNVQKKVELYEMQGLQIDQLEQEYGELIS